MPDERMITDHSLGAILMRLALLEQKVERQAGLVAECTNMLILIHGEQCGAMRRIEALEAALRARAPLLPGAPHA